MKAHAHLPGESLLELLLAGDSSALEEAAACPRCGPELADLAGVVGRVREVYTAEEARTTTSAFSERVLASTTREDLGWRGDLRLMKQYVRTRLRESMALRVAAASLLVHLFALPVLSLMLWQRAQEPQLTLRIEHAEQLPVESPEAEPRPPLDYPASLREQAQLVSDAQRDDRVRIRTASAPPAIGSTPPEDAIARLLWLRSRMLSGRGLDPIRADELRAAALSPDATVAVLAVEILLDQSLQVRHAVAGLAQGLAALDARARTGGTDAEWFRWSLARAAGYGWWGAEASLEPRVRVMDGRWRTALTERLPVPTAADAVAGEQIELWRAAAGR